jgi:rSAM/selenodomain-associated transferase 1
VTTVVVLAKEPVPGAVKTRLQTEFAPAEAAALARAALADTLAALPPVRRVLALAGEPGSWLPDGFTVIPQRGAGLAARICAAIEDAYDGTPVLLIGMDTPQVTPDLLEAAAADVARGRAVLGPSVDGGYWILGLPRPDPRVTAGVPMSTARTGAVQLDRLRALGYRVAGQPVLRDVDTPADLAAVAAAHPELRMSRLYQRLRRNCHPALLFDRALDGVPVAITDRDGRPMHAFAEVERWRSPVDAVDELAVSRCEGPVLDVGCGPGRMVTALAERGIPALGVDVSPRAVSLTNGRGGTALHRPVEDRLPAEGRWRTVLLMDGNIGIGGAPESLLRRCAELVAPAGLVMVETDADDQVDDRRQVVLHSPGGRRSRPLPWARIGLRRLLPLAAAAGLFAVEDWRAGGRAFVALRKSAR